MVDLAKTAQQLADQGYKIPWPTGCQRGNWLLKTKHGQKYSACIYQRHFQGEGYDFDLVTLSVQEVTFGPLGEHYGSGSTTMFFDLQENGEDLPQCVAAFVDNQPN
jgi:hypothetical protein